MTDQSAQYSVTPIIEDPQLDRGDDLSLDIYFSGNGDIDHNKLHIQFPFADVFEDGSSKFVQTTSRNGSSAEMKGSASNVGYTIGLNEAHFQYDESSDSPEEFGRIGGERDHSGNPPLLVKLSTKQGARPGNYTIPITFTYQDSNGNISQDYTEASFHVNSWQEENSEVLKKIAVIAAAATVLSFVGGPIVDILEWIYQLIVQAISFYGGILN